MSKQPKTYTGVLFDEISDKKLKAKVKFVEGHLCISVEGYGDLCSGNGDGWPIVVDLFDKKLQVIVWSDINQEDPTHNIDLSGAKESLRKETA